MTLLIEIIGWVGTIAYLLAYALLTLGYLKAQGKAFPLMNVIGGICLVVNTWESAPSVILNGLWALIGLYGFIRATRKKENPESQ